MFKAFVVILKCILFLLSTCLFQLQINHKPIAILRTFNIPFYSLDINIVCEKLHYTRFNLLIVCLNRHCTEQVLVMLNKFKKKLFYCNVLRNGQKSQSVELYNIS